MSSNQIDRYKIIGILGQGDMGQVYQAYDPNLDRAVVVKIVTSFHRGHDDAGHHDFKRQIQAAARLNHPHIVAIHDVNLEYDPPYVVMERLAGGTLGDFLRTGPLPWPEALTLIRPLLQALAYAHRAGVIHGNIKPGNVMFSGDEVVPPAYDNLVLPAPLGAKGIVKLVDFGLACQIDAGRPLIPQGALFDAPTYMSPEQARGEPVDSRTDIFALGVLFLEAIAGYNPLTRISVVSEQPLDLSLLVDKAPRELVGLFERVVAKNRAYRYPTCEAFLADLDAWLKERPDDRTHVSLRRIRRRPPTGPMQGGPLIQKAYGVDLRPEIERVLWVMFSQFKRIAVEAEFGQGLSGGHVFRVRLIKEEGKARLPAVVKIAPINLIHQEWSVYQKWVDNQLPGAARLESAPNPPQGSMWDGLRYALVGDGVFEVESLYSYYRQASVEDLWWILIERLYPLIGIHWWLEHRLDRAFQMQADYDKILPVNLVLKSANNTSSRNFYRISPEELPSTTLSLGSMIHLEGFVVTEINQERRQVTLDLATTLPDRPTAAYRIRLAEIDTLDRYRLGQIVDSLMGQVVATRQDLLMAEAIRAFGAPIDLSSQQLAMPVEQNFISDHPLIASMPPSLPNPLLAYQDMLHTFLMANISTVHGDLNLENILIDPATRHLNLIDFATVRQGHALHDLLRLETEVVTKLIPQALVEVDLPPIAIYTLYQELHRTSFHLGRFSLLEHLPQALEKPFVILAAIRKMARAVLFNPDDWTEYYQGLTLYLLGALKFKNLDRLPIAPLPKQVAFWGAATSVDLFNSPGPGPEISPGVRPPLVIEGQRLDKDLSVIARKIAAIIREDKPKRISDHNRPRADDTLSAHGPPIFDGAPSSASSSRDRAPLDIIVEETAHIFICYKPQVDADRQLATYLDEFLKARGHEVFIERTPGINNTSPEAIDQQIKASDFLIVLLSTEAADSEMVQVEVRQAYEYQKLQGRPHILPVRMAYEGWLPYAIEACVDSLQYLTWQEQADNQRIGQEILAAIGGRLPRGMPIQVKSNRDESIISEDGSLVFERGGLAPPLPAYDSRVLDILEAPGDAVKLRDRFYIDRDADGRLKRQVTQAGTVTTIRAPRQTGKSSLLVRGIQQARQNRAKIVHLDLQRLDNQDLSSPERFLRYLADYIVRKLRLNMAVVEKLWRGSQGPQEKLTYLLEDFILPASDSLLILAVDEADTLLQTSYHNDFFGMLRAWHNSAAYDEQWEKFNLVFAISTEPYLLISDIHQSPFNVGLKLYLEDFNEIQVRDLNWRHGSPVQEKEIPGLMELLSGHPYLTRKALYTLVTENLSWDELIKDAAGDQGIFGDHLRRQQWLLRDQPEMKAALKQIIQHQQCPPDERALYRLLRAGLVRKEGDACLCRCHLYRLYFAPLL